MLVVPVLCDVKTPRDKSFYRISSNPDAACKMHAIDSDYLVCGLSYRSEN